MRLVAPRPISMPASASFVFFLGVGGLIFVPIFKSITHLPPFVGILLVLGVLWTTTEIFYRHLPHEQGNCGLQKRVTNILTRIDMGTILFFLGILMAVACLEVIGVLTQLGTGLECRIRQQPLHGNGYYRCPLQHRRQCASRSRLYGHVSRSRIGRLCL